jgi:hypothetical protein
MSTALRRPPLQPPAGRTGLTCQIPQTTPLLLAGGWLQQVGGAGQLELVQNHRIPGGVRNASSRSRLAVHHVCMCEDVSAPALAAVSLGHLAWHVLASIWLAVGLSDV